MIEHASKLICLISVLCIAMQSSTIPVVRSKGKKLIIKANHFCCEIKGGGQQMAAMMLMLINFNNGCVHCYSLLALTSLQSFVGRHL